MATPREGPHNYHNPAFAFSKLGYPVEVSYAIWSFDCSKLYYVPATEAGEGASRAGPL